MKLFETKTIPVTKSMIFTFGFIVIIIATFVMSSVMAKRLYPENNVNIPDIDLEGAEMIQLDVPYEGQTIMIINTSAGQMKAAVFSEQCPEAARILSDSSEKLAGSVITPSENGVAAVISAPEKLQYTAEIHKDLWPIKGAVCIDANGNIMFVNTVEFTDEMKAFFSSEDSLKNVSEAFLEYGGIPNISGQYTVAAQVYEGIEVLEALTASDGSVTVENITFE